MRLDLHIHTTASDGAWTPAQIVAGAVEGGLDVIAVTDHDTTAGVLPAIGAARGHALQVVPGVELSSTSDSREVHILALGVDPRAPVLLAHRDRARRLRLERIDRMVAALAREEDIVVRFEDVVAEAGSDPEIVGRPHLARVLVAEGHARDVPDAFDRLIGNHRPSFVPTALQEPVDAVRVGLEAGGVPIWAHPPKDMLSRLLPELVDAGLQGLEAHRPETRPSYVKQLKTAAKNQGLLTSGGSDWHDLTRNRKLGHFWVGRAKIEPLIGRLEVGGRGFSP